MRIVRVANFVTARSGGLGTALRELGAGFERAGHEAVLIIPGPRAGEELTEYGRLITLPGPRVPATGGYRVLLDRNRLAATLTALRPDRLEVSDRSTLRWLGRWARRAGVPSMMVSHESLDGLLRLALTNPVAGLRTGLPAGGAAGGGRQGGATARWVTDRLNARTAAEFDTIVCTTRWAAAEFARVDARNVVRAPLGVDLDLFAPGRHDSSARRRWAGPDDLLLLHCGRLSAEKRPRRSLHALAGLRAAGVPAVLVIAGDGPLRTALRREAAERGLPVRFLGHVGDRRELSVLLATADIAIAPGPVETFGLAALEALASGTPVVVSAQSALPEVIGDAGIAAAGEGPAYAAAVRALAARPVAARRRAARVQAERYPWSAAVAGFLGAHGVDAGVPADSSAEPGQ